MKVWVFKTVNGSKRRGDVDPKSRRGVPCSTRSQALRAFQEEGEPVTEAGLFGLFVARYEDRYKRRWPFTSAGSVATVRDLVAMASRVGPKEAAKAIEVIFSAKFKWVTSHASALANRDFYAKHIIPALDEVQQVTHGEQSEWKARREGRGFEEVRL